MSVKDVINYYNQVCDDYHEMLENIKDFEEAANKNIIPPERVEEYKKSLEPIKVNYERISFIMYLLKQPVKKDKIPKYKRMNEKLILSMDSKNSLQGQLDENQKCLEDMKSKI